MGKFEAIVNELEINWTAITAATDFTFDWRLQGDAIYARCQR